MKNHKIKNNKKIYLTFILSMVILYVLGLLIGRIAANMKKSQSVTAVFHSLRETLLYCYPLAYIVIAAFLFILLISLCLNCIRMYKALKASPEDDDLWDTLEEKLNAPMILSNIISIANVFFFASLMGIVEFTDYGKNSAYETAILITGFIFVVVLFAAGIIVSKVIVDIEKKLNPEKKGNVFDFKFHDVWLASCDEAQKMITYKAAYEAFKKTNLICIALWIISFITMLVLNTGVYPIFCICAIWLVNNVSYMAKGAELEKRK